MTYIRPVAERPTPEPPRSPRREARPTRAQGRLAALLLSPTMIVLIARRRAADPRGDLRESLFTSGSGIDARRLRRPGRPSSSAWTTTRRSSHGDDRRTGSGTRSTNTTFFTVVCVVIEIILGVAMALIMNRAFRGRGLVRASILVPWAIPTVVSAHAVEVDLPRRRRRQRRARHTRSCGPPRARRQAGAVIIADTWKTAPFIGLLVLAGLQDDPGRACTRRRRWTAPAPGSTFCRITMPLVKPALLVAVLFRILDTLRMFDLPFVLVGPEKESVETLSILAYLESQPDPVRAGGGVRDVAVHLRRARGRVRVREAARCRRVR